MSQPINFQTKLILFAEQWSPKVIAEMNDYQFKLVKIKGEFSQHNHANTDTLSSASRCFPQPNNRSPQSNNQLKIFNSLTPIRDFRDKFYFGPSIKFPNN
tara:strand:- start:363 stop:662 length:300 start_codon:yes stop_codon:yes gene_type:complete